MEKGGFVYILASKRNGTLYVGVTSDLTRRIHEHHTSPIAGFTRKYGAKMLVYAEAHESIEDAIEREKQLKKWRRRWKLKLIESANPEWRDLYSDLV